LCLLLQLNESGLSCVLHLTLSLITRLTLSLPLPLSLPMIILPLTILLFSRVFRLQLEFFLLKTSYSRTLHFHIRPLSNRQISLCLKDNCRPHPALWARLTAEGTEYFWIETALSVKILFIEKSCEYSRRWQDDFAGNLPPDGHSSMAWLHHPRRRKKCRRRRRKISRRRRKTSHRRHQLRLSDNAKFMRVESYNPAYKNNRAKKKRARIGPIEAPTRMLLWSSNDL
jgi:hypothetical protein